MEPTELQSNANDLIEQIDMQHSRHMRLSALVDYQLRYPDMTIKEFGFLFHNLKASRLDKSGLFQR